VKGVLLVELVSETKLRAEFFCGTTEATVFTPAAITYSR